MPSVSLAATTAQTAYSQYVAFQAGVSGEPSGDKWTIGEYTYNRKTVDFPPDKDHPEGSQGTFWVRDGYFITVTEGARYEAGTNPKKNFVINAFRDDATWDEDKMEGLLSSLQLSNGDMGVTTLNGKNLQTVAANTYLGAVNSQTTKITSNNQFFVLYNGKWIDVGGSQEKLDHYFKEVKYSDTLGGFYYDDGNGNNTLIDPSNMYVINGQAGVFIMDDGSLYTGSVYGANNEILVTGKDGNTYYSYWGAEQNDPNATIGDKLTVGAYNQTISALNNNIEAIHEDDIQKITVAAATGENANGGTIGLLTNGTMKAITDERGNIIGYEKVEGGTQASIPGAVTITSIAENGKDTKIQFSNDDGSFTVAAGSRVEANPGSETESSTLSSISINGNTYTIPEGGADVDVIGGTNIASVKTTEADGKKTYTVNANGTTVSGDGTAEEAGNIIVTAGEKDATTNLTNYSVKLNDDITLGTEEGNHVSISGTHGTMALYSKTDSGKEYNIIIGNGAITGLTNEITDWSTFVSDDSEAKTSTHAATLAELYELSQHSVFYAMNGNAIDYGTINLANSYSNKSGGTLIYNVAYAVTDANAEGYNGSAAVNVDLLKDYVGSAVDDAKTEMKASDQHLVANPESTDGAYSVNKTNHDVTLKVDTGTKDEDDKPIYSDVTIKDVASASEVGDISSIREDLKNETGDTTVVDAINNLDDKVGSADFSSAKTEGVKNAENVTDAILALDDKVGAAATEAGKHSTVSGGAGITVTNTNDPTSADYDSTKGANYEVALSDDFTLGGKEGQSGSITVTGSEGTISATGNISAGSFTSGNIVINGKDSANTINGLANTTWDANHIVSGQAATEDQLKAATEGAVQYDRKDGAVDKSSITLGDGNGGTTAIHNVADGTATHDAVNVGQLQQVENQVINNSMNISMLEGSIHRLDNRIDRVGAGAAALAALHPLDYDPDAKWDFAAGVGNYRSATATAIGAYYRPNEDVMFSVGGSFGGGENMVNAGVSFKLGSGSGHVTTSKAAMARELAAMKETVAQQNAQIEQQAAQIAELTALVQKLAGEAAASETDAEA